MAMNSSSAKRPMISMASAASRRNVRCVPITVGLNDDEVDAGHAQPDDENVEERDHPGYGAPPALVPMAPISTSSMQAIAPSLWSGKSTGEPHSYADPGWCESPSGTVAQAVSKQDLERDKIKV